MDLVPEFTAWLAGVPMSMVYSIEAMATQGTVVEHRYE